MSRDWEVQSASATTRLGKPTAYHLIPQPAALLMARPDSYVYGRASIRHSTPLGVGSYGADELWPAGRYPTATPGGRVSTIHRE